MIKIESKSFVNVKRVMAKYENLPHEIRVWEIIPFIIVDKNAVLQLIFHMPCKS